MYDVCSQSLKGSLHPVVDCWEDSYTSIFKFQSDLIDLENQLLEKKIIDNNSVASYATLFKKMSTESTTRNNWLDVNIRQYISASPFKYCLKKHKPSKLDLEIRRWGYLFSIYHILSQDFATINIKAFSQDSILVNNIPSTLDTFKQIFKIELEVMDQQETPREEVHVNVSLHPINKDSLFIEVLKKKLDDYHLDKINFVKPTINKD